MRAQKTGLDKKTVLNIRPAFLIVPASLELKAEQLVAQNLVPAQSGNVVPQSTVQQAKTEQARLKVVEAQEAVQTAKDVAIAERGHRLAILRAAEEADVDGAKVKSQVSSMLAVAKAEGEATELKGNAERLRLVAEAEGRRAQIEAENHQSDAVLRARMEMHRLDRMPEIAAQMMKPVEKIDSMGLVIERLVIRFLYGRLVDTMLATWGLSLLLIGLATFVFGNTTTGISPPIAGFAVGDYQVSGYNLFIILVTVVLIAAIFAVLTGSRWGLIARGAMQRADMASALGYNPGTVYMTTFFVGSALTGLAGGVLAPLVGIVPTSGAQFIAKAFITVITGGASIIAGLLSSATLFGLVSQAFTFLIDPMAGEIALLVAAVVLLRLMPQGITGRFFKGSL